MKEVRIQSSSPISPVRPVLSSAETLGTYTLDHFGIETVGCTDIVRITSAASDDAGMFT